MIKLIDSSLLVGLAKAIGSFFLNPLFYWFFLLVIVAGYRRIQQERVHFGFKVFDLFSEWKSTLLISIVTGLFISLIAVGIGMVFSYEMILLLSIVIIVLSLTFKFTMLSASYTIGITYLLLLLSPLLLENQSYLDANLFSLTNYTSLIILLGVFLIAESLLMARIKHNESFPEITLSDRGLWVGQHHLKKLSLIPFFVLVPSGFITPFTDFWPFFAIGEESYGLLLVPFIIGFDETVRGGLPLHAARKMSRAIRLLGYMVILLGIGSIYLSWVSIIAVVFAILGREYIIYQHRKADNEQIAYFSQMETGLKVLGTIPGTTGDRLEILVGETITKVNDQKVATVKEFYHALQNSGAYFKLDVIDRSNEVRFVQGAFYEGDHHELGIIFTERPYREKKKSNTA